MSIFSVIADIGLKSRFRIKENHKEAQLDNGKRVVIVDEHVLKSISSKGSTEWLRQNMTPLFIPQRNL